MAKILYIHGFGSCGDSNKTRLLKKYFGDDLVIAPDVKIDPNEAIEQLEALITTDQFNLLIGSSLGGYYATYLSEKFHLRAILINPSTQPFETLAPYVGENKLWCTGATFIWEAQYLEALKAYQTEALTLQNYMLFLQTGDEVLDYKVAYKVYEGANIIVQEGGNHRFENLDEYLEYVETFLI